MTDIPEPQRREVPKYYERGLMQTVRTDVKQTFVHAKDPAIKEAVNRGVVDDILDKTECSVWRKFDVLRAEGAFKKKVVFVTLDGSSTVEGFLHKIFGDRPAGCA